MVELGQMSSSVYRLLDANLNRASEGLRVAEDVARFVLDDECLSTGLRSVRHELATMARPLGIALLTGRDSPGDHGRESGLRVGSGQRDMLDLVRANMKRSQESLRVIEELAQTPDVSSGLDATVAERLRYQLYEYERALAARVSRSQSADSVRGLYVIVDTQVIGSRAPFDVANAAVRGGASVVQFRDKRGSPAEVLHASGQLQELCNRAGVLFVVNDCVDVAAALRAPALHLGQNDMPLDVARRLLPIDTIVGVSCHSESDVCAAAEAEADYIAVGSVFPTQQKENAVIVGTSLVSWARTRLPKTPLVAIGGIDADNVGEVAAAGADAIAVIGAVVARHDVEAASKNLSARWTKATQERKGETDGSA